MNKYEKPKGWSDISLCWFCQRATRGDIMCRWAKRSEPVPGWVAKPDTKKNSVRGSYMVTLCPKYVPDEKVLAAVMGTTDFTEFNMAINKHYGNIPRKKTEIVYRLVSKNREKFVRMGVDYVKGMEQLAVKQAGDYKAEKEEPKPVNPAEATRRKLYEYDGNTRTCKKLYRVKMLYRKNFPCTAEDCIYAGLLTGVGNVVEKNGKTSKSHCCGYLQATGRCRSIVGKHKVHQVQENGRCDLYQKGRRVNNKQSAEENWRVTS